MDLVCPNCGHNKFRQQRIRTIETRVLFDSNFGMDDSDELADEEIMDEDGQDNDVACDDCGEVYSDAEHELVTEKRYSELLETDDEFDWWRDA